MSFELYPNEK